MGNLTPRVLAQKIRELAIAAKLKFQGRKEPRFSDEDALKIRAYMELGSMLIDSIDPVKLKSAFEFAVSADLAKKGNAEKLLKGVVAMQHGLSVISSAVTAKNLNHVSDFLTAKRLASMNVIADCLEQTESVDRSEIVAGIKRVRDAKIKAYEEAFIAEEACNNETTEAYDNWQSAKGVAKIAAEQRYYDANEAQQAARLVLKEAEAKAQRYLSKDKR